MSWWWYVVLGICYRAAHFLIGPTAGNVVGVIILAGVLAYWVRRAWLALKDRRERRRADRVHVGPGESDHPAH